MESLGLKTPQDLNKFLASKSYIVGYAPSQADVSVFAQIANGLDEAKLPHVSRWHSHIASFSIAERLSWPGEALKVEKKAEEEKKVEDEDEESDFNMSDSDEDEEVDLAALKKKKEEEAKAAKKKEKVDKSSLIFDVKPDSAETDMDALEEAIRAITMDGLLWGGQDIIPVAYGIKKLRIIATVEDEKVSIDELQEAMESLEQVQSTDIHAFNKV